MSDAIGRVAKAIALTISIMALLLVTGAMIGQVIWRYILIDPLQWSEAISSYGLVFVVFIGAGVLAFEDLHISIPSLVDFLPPAGRACSTVIVRVLTIVFCAVALYESYRWLHGGAHAMATTLGISTRWIKAALPGGFALIGLAAVLRLIGNVKAIRAGDYSRFPRAFEKES